MLWIERLTENLISAQAETRPVLLLTGIRQAGKSALLKRMFPEAEYVTFDHYHTAQTAEENPAEFLSSLTGEQIILDEVQYVPTLFRELKIIIDRDRKLPARWILTGSQKFVLLESAKESLAGRISLIDLATLGANELRSYFDKNEIKNLLWKGGFPETWSVPQIDIYSYLDDYITTYLEKDLRSIIQTPNLRDFHRFLRACSVRAGSLVNYADTARDTGISPNTAKSWLNTLERSGIVTLLEPWFRNISKRLTKTPKLYFNDQGLLCRFLNINSYEEIEKSPYAGAIWENFVFNELIRTRSISAGRNLFFYRDQNNVEADFLIEKNNIIYLLEAKYSERPGKTNINSIYKALGQENLIGGCACRIPEKGVLKMKNVYQFNPLYEPVESFFEV